MTEPTAPQPGQAITDPAPGAPITPATPPQDTPKGTAPADAGKTGEAPQGADPGATGAAGQDSTTTTEPAGEAFQFTYPDGVTADPQLVEGFSAVARELGLSQDQAQKIVDAYAGRIKADADAIAAQQQAWKAEIQSDPELGGKNHERSIAAMNKALDSFADPSFVDLLEALGLRDHPGVRRTFTRLGLAISEDAINAGRPGAARDPERTKLAKLYPSMAGGQ